MSAAQLEYPVKKCERRIDSPVPIENVILISSGVAVNDSPLSGGYAGGRRMQMFLAHYAQKEADRLQLVLRFLALVPGGLYLPLTWGKWRSKPTLPLSVFPLPTLSKTGK